jgi:hypothetical protein
MQNLRADMISRWTAERDEALAMAAKLDRMIKEHTVDESRPMPGPSDRTISDTIRQAVREKSRTSIEVIDRVVSLLSLPKEQRGKISAIIGQRVSAREFVKDEMGKLRIARPLSEAS